MPNLATGGTPSRAVRVGLLTARRRLGVALAALVALGGSASACGKSKRGPAGPDSVRTEAEAQRYIKRAIRSSSEGWVLLPSKRAEVVFELPRLNEIAQEMRRPAAACFLRRAIETMETQPDTELGYAGVPEGQIKIRARINPAGEVVRAEVLESGFGDDDMGPCLTDVIRQRRFPQNPGGNTHFIDAVYWVSLGAQGDVRSAEYRDLVKRESVAAGVRAKKCLQGRVDAGTYQIDALNLIDREGATMVNRVDHPSLPGPIRRCIAGALKEIRLEREPDAFVRPVTSSVMFHVTQGGTVAVKGEDWLRLVQLEEKAKAAAKRAELTGEDPDDMAVGEQIDDLPARRPSDPRALGADDAPPNDAAAADGPDATKPPAETTPPASDPPADPPAKKVDPGQGGLRLDLGARG